ncbi:MAG: Spx/MgsR family RNA polymerase-binding regulatory protein [Neisseria sp.]|nr:Spx/MgsR family RNA polymerase-binding regulatory protein [Neisseria sp.]
MVSVYGIANCGSVKKARAWLAERGVEAAFVDFKQNAPAEAQVRAWLADIPLAVLLNRRGAAWRGLDEAQRRQAGGEDGAVALMCALPNLIKRPVLETDGRFYCGFDETVYGRLFPGRADAARP